MDDIFLDHFDRSAKHKILGGFAQRVREKTYSPRAHRKMLNWLQQHALAPSEAYLRPSARQVNLIPLWTEMEKLHSFYRDSGKDIEMKTQAHGRKKRSLSMS